MRFVRVYGHIRSLPVVPISVGEETSRDFGWDSRVHCNLIRMSKGCHCPFSSFLFFGIVLAFS